MTGKLLITNFEAKYEWCIQKQGRRFKSYDVYLFSWVLKICKWICDFRANGEQLRGLILWYQWAWLYFLLPKYNFNDMSKSFWWWVRARINYYLSILFETFQLSVYLFVIYMVMTNGYLPKNEFHICVTFQTLICNTYLILKFRIKNTSLV